MLRRSLFVKTLLGISVLACVALFPAVIGGAQTPQNHAGLVVRFGDGSVQKFCIAFAEEQISGLDLLIRSGLPLLYEPDGIGAAVCKIGPDGCNYPAEQCFCKRQPDFYWAYHFLDNGAWRYSPLGSSTKKVSNGDVQGWAWGQGTNEQGAQPPLVSFAEVCGNVAVPSITSTATATATQSTTATPSPTTQNAATATPSPLPTNTAAPAAPAPPADVMPVASATAPIVVRATDLPAPSATTAPRPTDTPVPTATLAATTVPPTAPADTAPSATALPLASPVVATDVPAPPTALPAPTTAAAPTAPPPAVLAAQAVAPTLSPPPSIVPTSPPATAVPAGGAAPLPTPVQVGSAATEAQSVDYLTFGVLALLLLSGIGWRLWRRKV